MLLKSFLVAGTVALHASAFLVPAGVSHKESDVAQFTNQLKHQTLELDCPGCPFVDVGGDGSVNLEEDSPNTIHLEFDISDDNKFIQVNGQPIYPPPKTLIPISLKAEQVRTSDSHHGPPLRLGYAVEILPTTAEITDISLTPIQLTIVDLQGVLVKVDTVRLDLIQSWGNLHIARVSRVAYSKTPGAQQCSTSFCRIRAIIAARVRKMMEAAKAQAGKAKTWIKSGCRGRPKAVNPAAQDHGRSHRHGPSHRMGRVRQILKWVGRYFILPGLAGFLGGYLVCTLILMVGHAVARRVSRRSSGGAPCPHRVVEEALRDEEKDGFLENGELPPQYEDVEVIIVEQK